MLLQHRVGNTYVVSRRMRVLTHSIIGFFLFGQMQIVVAQTSIVPTTTNGWATTATTSGNVTEITNTRNIGGNAYNSFEKFGVAAGQTVNLRMEGADNLVNLIRFDRTDINGVLNSYLANGSVGGNVFFVNPNGITVGTGGVVNVGSLSMVVPTQKAMDDYIAALQDAGSTVDDRLLFIGGLKLDENGEIDIKGSINANGGVLLLANTVNISGNITSSGLNTAASVTGAELFSALVKVSADFQDDLGIFEVNGEIVIGAAGSSDGIIDGISLVKNTSATININSDANIQAVGDVQLSANAKQVPVSIDNGLVEWNTTSATVDVTDASIRSTSGEVVIDADSSVDLEIGGLDGLPISAAIARSDAKAQVSVAGNSAIEAATDVSISASTKTKISATANAESETATLTIAVANIDSSSSAVITGSSTIDAGGAVTIDSVSDADVKVMADGLLSDGSGGGLAIAVTDVDSKSTASISGSAQILNSGSLAVTSAVANSIDTAARSVVSGDPQSISEAVNGEDNLNDNPSGDPGALKANINTALDDSADLEDDGQATSPQLAAAFAYTGVDSSSIATIDSGVDDAAGATIKSTGDIKVIAKSMTDASNLAQGTTAVGASASITAGVSILVAKEVISATVKPEIGKLALTGNVLNVAALNEDYSAADNTVGEMLSIAYAGAGGGGDMGLAGALAINIQDRDSIANVSGDGSLFINIDGDLDIAASSSVSDAVVASALLSEAQAQDAEDKFAANSAAQQDATTPGTNPDEGGSLGVGAAIALNIIDNNTQANVGSGVSIANTADNMNVDANSASAVITKAEAGSAGGISIVPVLALSSSRDTTLASIDAGGSAIDVQDSILVNAKHSGSVATYAKGSPGEQGGGGTVSVGASVGLGIASETTTASIVRNVVAGTGATNTVTVSSFSNSSFATGAIAGSGGSSDEGDGTTVDSQLAGVVAYRNSQSSDTASTESAETSDGKVGVAAAIAYQGTTSSAESSVADGISVTAGGKLAVTSQKQTSAGAKANGAAAGANAGVAAAVAITTTTNSNIARIGDDAGPGNATMATGGIDVIAYSDDAYVDNSVMASQQALSQFGSAAVAGASSQGVGVAGALALNILSDTTNASIEGDALINISAAPVSVGAESQSNTDVNAAGTVGIVALEIEEPETPSVSESGTPPGGTTASGSSSVGVGAGVAVNAASNNTVARIGSGVSFAAASNVSVDASSKADATVASTAGVAGDATAAVGVGGAVAVSVIADNTRAEIENRNEILISNAVVSVSASHSGTISVSTDGSAAGSNAAIGASIAISVSDVIIQALLSRDVTASNVNLAASSNTSNITVAKASASGAEQEDPPATDPAPGKKTGVDKKSADLTTFAGDKKAGGSADDPESESAETPGGAVTVAAGLAVTVTQAIVNVENTGNIVTTGKTSITSESAADAKATADGSAVDGSNSVGVGVAVAVNTLTQSNTATARNITSGGGLTVGATQIADEENDTGAVATSGAGASNVGVAGSVAVNVVNNKSIATFANGTVTGGVVDIDASNKTNSVTKAGSSVVGSGSSVGVGAGIAVDVVVNEILAVITSAADVTSSDSVAVDADSTFTAEVKGEAGGQGDAQPSGGAVGVSGAVAVGVYSNRTKAEIAAGNALASSGEVHVAAIHTNKINIETGADAAGDKAAIGVSIAISVSKAETDALISRNVTAGSMTIAASSSTSNATKAKASASGAAPKEDAASGGSAPADDSSVNKDVDGWQTFGTDKDDSGSTGSADTEKADASSSEGQVSVAGAVAVTVTDVDTVARIDNDVSITTANNVAVTSTANTDAQATADGSAANGGVGVGVGVAINVANNYNAAFIAQGADVQAGNIAVTAGMTEDVIVGEPDPDTVNSFSAQATSGAGAAKVGVAGSLALNTVTNESTAYIAGNENAGTAASVYITGDLSVSAINNARHVAKAQASVSGTGGGSGKSVGIGASVAINTFINKANAEIRDGVTIAGNRLLAGEAGSLTMASSSEYNSETKAEAGAEGEEGADPSNDIAVDAAVALIIADNETRTTVGAVDTSAGFSGDIDLDASSNQSNTTEADGDTAGSQVAIGAVAAVNLGSSNTSIVVNTDLKTSAGSIAMDAKSTSADKALAKASARGASKKKAQDKYGATEEEIDSGDYGNGADDKKATSSTVLSDNSSTMEQPETGDTEVDDKSGDKGKWNVSIAAAVGANVVDNDTTVIVASDKTLAAGGTIDVNASSDSNYMTRGSGEAVADSGSGKGIGIGIGVAVTVASNDTVAEVSSIENAGNVSITASSTQNMNEDFIRELTSEAIAGASADKVAVAGAVATVVTNNNTRAEIVDDAIIGDIGALNVSTSDQSKISSRAIAWVDPAKKTTAGVGASVAILVSKNTNTARIGDGVIINSADSINVEAVNKRVTPDTVGLNFDDIIDFDDILNSALLAGRTEASGDDSDNTGTEPDVDPETGGPSLIFDKLETTAVDAKHALEDYIRSHNYYTEAAAGSASTSGSAKYGVAGSFAVTVLQNKTEASIGNVTVNNVAGNVDVTADTDTDIVGFTGSVVKAGNVGVGVSATTLVNVDSTRALLGNDSVGAVGTAILGAVDAALNIGDLNVSASSDQDILGIGVSAAAASASGGSGVVVSGVLNTTVLVNEAEARIANDAKIYSTGSVDVAAEGITDIVSVVGGIALAGKVGVGASVGTAVISGQTHAAIGDRATVVAADSVAVAAAADESIISIVVGAGASKKVGVAGSVATNIVATSTTATIGTDAVITQTAARDAETALNAISVQATDNTRLFGLAGGGAIGSKAGVGVAADVAVFSKNTVAETKAGSILTAAGNVDVSANSKDDIISLTGAGAASSSGAAVAGVASVKVIVDKTQALINSQSVYADGNVDLLAQSDTDLNIYDGTIAISGGSAGVGGAVSVNTIVKDTAARVGAGVVITARGDVEDSQVYNGELDRSGYTSIGSIARPDSDDEPAIGINAGELTDAEKQTVAHRGLSVTAFTTEDIETVGISASASRSVAVAGNLSVDVIANTTDAAIGAGATVNATGVDATDNSSSVLVQAYDYTDLNAMLGGGAVGASSAGVGAAGDVSSIIKKTNAHIDANANITAEQDVAILAGSEEDIDSIAVAVGVGSSAGVSGAASVLVIDSQTRAYTESNTDINVGSNTINIDAGRDFVVEALDRTDLFVFNTALAAGSSAGVGGSAGIVVLTNVTEAKVGRGTVSNADRRAVVHAATDENLIGIAMGGAGGGSAGVSGQLGVHVLATDTAAIVEDDVTMNKASWNDVADEDEQSVAVIASNDVELLSISGTISLGGSAGVGGALTADVVTNKVRASVGKSEIYAGSAGNGNVDLGDGLIVEDGVSVRATSDKTITAVSIAGAGGGSAGVAGAASILIVGSDNDENDETSDSFGGDMDTFTSTGEGGSEPSQLAAADSGSDSRTGDTLGVQGDVEVSDGVSVARFVDDKSQTSGSAYFTLDSASGTSGDTVAVIASGATIKTQGDLEVSANDDTNIVVVGGSIAVGGSAGVAGAGALVLLNQGTRAIVQDDDINAVELDAARTMNINAQADSKIVDVTATVAAGGAAGVSGSLLLNVVDSRAEARIGDGALINQDGNIVADNAQSVIVDANNSTNLVATTANGSGSGTAAVGGVALVNVITSRTNASIGQAARVSAQRDIMVIADTSEQVIANGASAAISGVAGVGGVINTNTIISITDAVISADAVVDSEGNVLVAAEDDTSLISNAWGIAIGLGGAGVGGSFGVNTIVKDTSATITEGATVIARGNNLASIDVYTGELVSPGAGDNLIDGLISRIQADEPEEPEESDSSGGPSQAQSQGQADKWQTVVDQSGANQGEDDLQTVDSSSLGNTKKSRVSMKGLAVVASSTEDIVSSNASAAGGLYAGVSGSGQVLSVVTDTDATVEKGVSIESEDLRLSAGSHTRSLSLSGGLAISGVAGVGGVIVSGNIIKTTNATLGSNAAAGQGVNVVATGDVLVDADSSEDIDEVLVNVAGAGIAGVGGGIASHVVVSETTAEVGNNAVIDGDSDLRVRAEGNTEIDTFSGNMSLAGIAAVGGVVSSNVVANKVTARIGDDAKTDADDVTEVSTDSVTDLETITVAASGGGVGVAGDVAVNVITTTAQSSIGQNALVNTDGTGNVGQDVLVNATDSSSINSDTGTIALGAVAVGGALSVDILRNSASATIGNNAEVNARDNIDVTASTVKTLDAKAVSAAAGGVGMSGSIAVAAIGGNLNDDAYKQINGEDENGDTNSESGSINKTSSSSGVNPLASDDENSQLNDFNATSSLADDVDQRNADREADYGVSDDVASSPDPRSGTLAAVGSGARLKAGGDLNVTALDTTSSNLLSGAVSAGGVAGAGAASITVVENNTEAMIASNATLDAGADLTVSAANNKTLNATAASGAVSFATSVAGSVGVTVDSSTARAHVDDGVKINQDAATRALASQQNVVVQAVNNAVIDVITAAVSVSGFFGLGGTLNVVTTSQTTEALINVGATGRVSAEGLINVDADSIATSNANSVVGAGGLQAGIAGGVVTLFDDSTTSASIGSTSVIDEADEVNVTADSTRTATAATSGLAVGAVGVGGSEATAEMKGSTTASVAADAKLGTNAAIGSLDVNATATETATANAIALAAGIISGAGAVATTRIESTVSASTGRDTQIVATGAVGVTAQATPKASSRTTAGSFGAATIGASVAVVAVEPIISAIIDGSDIEAGSLQVSSRVLTPGSGRTADAYAEAASGGLLLGANATVSDTSVKGRATTLLATDTRLDIGGNTSITAIHNSNQYAETKSFAAGLAALGGAFSSGKADTVSTVTIADGSSITSASLKLDASGDDRNQVKAKAGTGGAVAGAAAVTNTENTSITSVTVGDGTIVTEDLDVDARHTARFDQQTDSTSAGLLGASGAVGDNAVDAQVTVTLAGTIEAGMIDARASNNVYKNLVSGYNVKAGAGGIFGGAAADSDTVIDRMTAIVSVAPDTVITSGDNVSEGIILEAFNQLIVDDSAKLDSGGAIAVALADASIIASNVTAAVTIGDRASIETGGDFIAAAASRLNVQVDAKASTYGLAGAAQGQSTAKVTVDNSVTAGTDSNLVSRGLSKLMAGRRADNQAQSQTVLAYTDLWNKTVIPIKTKPQADADLRNNNRVNVAAGSVVAAGGDIHLVADQGASNVKGQGIGKDLYRQALEAIANFFGSLVGAKPVSLDIHGGSTTNIASETVTVNGLVHAGIDNKLKFRIVRNESNNDLEFYEGDYIAGMTPSLIIRDTGAGLIGIDSAGNEFAVVIDADGNYVIAPSDEGLSTTVKLDVDFNPLQVMLDRLNEVNGELDDIFLKSGGYTATQVTDRDAFYATGLQDKADAEFADGLLNNVFAFAPGGEVSVYAGVLQIRDSITTADSAASGGQVIDAPLTLWQDQKAGLLTDANEWESGANDGLGLTAADKANIIADLRDQATEIDDNLIVHALAINTDLADIATWQAEEAADPNVDNSTLIAEANTRIDTERGLLTSYDSGILAGRETELVTTIGDKTTSSLVAFAARDAIEPNLSNIDGTLQPYVDRLTQERDWIQGRVDDYGGTDAAGSPTISYELIDFTDKLTASSSDLFVDSRGLTGTGSLIASRDVEISILNKTPAYLRISGGAEIPFDGSGRVYVNGAPIRTDTLGDLTIGDGSAVGSMIKFLNDYAPPAVGGTSLEPPQGPDLIISENLSNFNGLIHLESLYGGVTTEAGVRIDADTIVIRAGRDVVLSYAGGIRHIAGDVKCNFSPGSDNCTSASGVIPGVVAGNNVYIAGEYLNINGKIQSGIPVRTITIDGTGDGQWENDGLVNKKIDGDGNTYFEVNPIFIAGGYVDLYGHIISTPVDPGNAPAGEIQVMDGYGEIEVINNTDLDVRVKGMSAGTGVQAKVRITDLDFDLQRAGNDKVTEYTYYRDNAADQRVDVSTTYLGSSSSQWKTDVESDSLTYDPLPGQQYSWENIRKDGWQEDRDVVQETWFFVFKSDKNEISRSDPVKTSFEDLAPIKDDLVVTGRPAGVSTAGAYATQETTTNTVSSGWSEVSGTRTTTDNYLVYKRVVWDERHTGTDFVYVKNFVTADKPIDINFVGNSSGAITLTANGAGNIEIAGSILNPTGTTSIDAGGGDILQSNDAAQIWSKDLSLSGRSIGEAIPLADNSTDYVPVEINLVDGGRLFDINVSTGNIVIEELDGDLLFGEMVAANGEIWLKASDSILNDEAAYPVNDNELTAERITLIAKGGAVGSSDNAVRVDSGVSADGGLAVQAATDTYINKMDGDLYLISAASSAGDVNINVTNGSLVDNNAVEIQDSRTIEQLLGIWDSMEFITETTDDNTTSPTYDVAERNVQATETLKTREYQTYWRYRNNLAEPSAPVTDTTITLSETEASFFDNPDAVAAERSAEFARLNELYAELGNTYDANYRYEVVDGSDEYVSLTKNAGWSELELLATFGPGLLKEISDTEIRIEDANASGNNINITVQNGDVGTYKPDAILIDLDAVVDFDYTDLSDAQKLALLTAERSDVRLDGYDAASDSYRQMYISTYDDVDVEATGTLTVDALDSQRVYIGSEGDLDITRIVGAGDIRIRTAGVLSDSSAASNAAVTGKDIILESGNQSIGFAAQAFTIDQLVDGSLTARAGDSIWLESTQSNPLAIDTVFASNLFSLKTAADVVEYEPDTGVDVRADSVALDIAGSFGAAGDLINSIDVGLNPEGTLSANIVDGAWISSPDRDLRIGQFEVGATSRVVGNGDLNLQSENGGIVSTGGKLTLLAGGSIVDEIMTVFDADGEVVATNDGARAIEALELDLLASNGDIGAVGNYLDIAVTGSEGVWAQADNGSIYIESPDNDLRLRHVSAGDDSALTSSGDVLLIQSGDYRSSGGTLAFEAGGSILDESGDSLIEAIDLSLRAGTGSIGTATRSLQVDTQSISRLSAASGMYLTETRGDMNVGYLYNGAGDAVLHVASPGAWLNISDGVVDGRMLWTADNVQVDKLVHGGNAEELYFEVTSSSGGMADVVNIAYRSEKKVRFGNLEATQARVIGDVNDLRFDRVLIGEQAVLSNDRTSVFVDNLNSGLHKQYTIQLTSQDKPFYLTFVPDSNKIETDAILLYYDEDWIVNEFGTENSLSRLVEKDLAYLKGPIPDVRTQTEHSEDNEPVDMNDDALNMQLGDDSEIYLPMYWSDI